MHSRSKQYFVKPVALVIYSLLACTACSSFGDDPDTLASRTLEMTPETAKFMHNFHTRQLTKATNNIPLQVSIRVGHASEPDIVCQYGDLYGPYTLENGQATGSQTASATPSTLRLANQGNLGICMVITSPVDATIDVKADKVAINGEECTEDPADIAGAWRGPYTCNDSCSGEYSSTIEFTLSQNGNDATYHDGEALYEGVVCGNRFEYSGGDYDEIYTESGTFILNADGTASKTSSYSYIDSECEGTCSDPDLERQ